MRHQAFAHPLAAVAVAKYHEGKPPMSVSPSNARRVGERFSKAKGLLQSAARLIREAAKREPYRVSPKRAHAWIMPAEGFSKLGVPFGIVASYALRSGVSCAIVLKNYKVGHLRPAKDQSKFLAGPQRDAIADGCGMGSESGNKLLVPDGRPQVCLGVRRLWRTLSVRSKPGISNLTFLSEIIGARA